MLAHRTWLYWWAAIPGVILVVRALQSNHDGKIGLQLVLGMFFLLIAAKSNEKQQAGPSSVSKFSALILLIKAKLGILR